MDCKQINIQALVWSDIVLAIFDKVFTKNAILTFNQESHVASSEMIVMPAYSKLALLASRLAVVKGENPSSCLAAAHFHVLPLLGF